MITTKGANDENDELYGMSIYRKIKALTNDIINAPITLPGRLPNPPSITTDIDNNKISHPIKG